METKCDRYWLFGRAGEDVMRVEMKRRGYFVLDVASMGHFGAPMLESEARKLVMPDILAARDGAAGNLLVDVKSKRAPSRNRDWGRWEDAIAIRHYEDYLTCGRVLRMPVALLFVHALDGEALFGRLDEVSGDARFWDPGRKWFRDRPTHRFKEPMVFFNVDRREGTRFEVWTIGGDEARVRLRAAAIPPPHPRPWELQYPPRCGQPDLPGF